MKRRSLYERQRSSVYIGRLRIRVKLDFWRVLLAMDIFDSDKITLDDKVMSASSLFCWWSWLLPFRSRAAIVSAVFAQLFPGGAGGSGEPPVMDFRQDAGAIRAAFLQAYGIALDGARLHYLDFVELLQNLPENTAFAKIVEIRQRPLPKPTKHNGEEIKALQRAKAAVALEISDADRQRFFAESLKRASIG